jgi:hypothetical protein
MTKPTAIPISIALNLITMPRAAKTPRHSRKQMDEAMHKYIVMAEESAVIAFTLQLPITTQIGYTSKTLDIVDLDNLPMPPARLYVIPAKTQAEFWAIIAVDSFYTWWSKYSKLYQECPRVLFYLKSARFHPGLEHLSDPLESVVVYLMNPDDNELWVITDKQRALSFKNWDIETSTNYRLGEDILKEEMDKLPDSAKVKVLYRALDRMDNKKTKGKLGCLLEVLGYRELQDSPGYYEPIPKEEFVVIPHTERYTADYHDEDDRASDNIPNTISR